MGKWRMEWKGVVFTNKPVSVCCLYIDPEYFKPPSENKQDVWHSNKMTKTDAASWYYPRKAKLILEAVMVEFVSALLFSTTLLFSSH